MTACKIEPATAADLVVLSLHLRARGMMQGRIAMCGHRWLLPLGQLPRSVTRCVGIVPLKSENLETLRGARRARSLATDQATVERSVSSCPCRWTRCSDTQHNVVSEEYAGGRVGGGVFHGGGGPCRGECASHSQLIFYPDIVASSSCRPAASVSSCLRLQAATRSLAFCLAMAAARALATADVLDLPLPIE